MVNILLGILGTLMSLVVIMAVWGALLPMDHVATRHADFPTPPDALWKSLVDVERAPGWRKDLQRVEVLPAQGNHRRFRETTRQGAITFAVEEETQPTRLVTRIADENLPFGGTWNYELAPQDGGTRVTITERGFVKNVIFRFLSHFFFSQTSTMERYLRDLAAHHGVTVTPQP